MKEKFTFSVSPMVCSSSMTVEIEDDIIRSLEIQGGCQGNSTGICRLVEGMRVEEVIRRLEGISCGGKPTSCPDQLAQGLKRLKNIVPPTA